MKTLNIQRNRLIIVGSLFIVLFLAGCTGAETPAPTASPTVTLVPTATALPPTATPTAAPTATASPTNTPESGAQAAPSGDRAAFVSETYPDNSVLEGGESFTKAFELRNAGNETWTTDYALVRDETNPAGETLGAGDRLALPQAVGPGETLTLELPLTAPEDPGTYTVYWTLRDANGAVVPVDGVQRIWATIRVCADGQDCSAPVVAAGGGSVSASSVSLTLTKFTYDAQSTTVYWCFYIPDVDWRALREYMPWPSSPTLLVDQKTVEATGGRSDFTNGDGCSSYTYQIGATEIEQAEHITLVVNTLRMNLPPGNPDDACRAARTDLIAQYPGLDFQCNFSMAGFYTELQVPAGMTREQADTLIMDTIEGAIYGPWELTIK